MNIMERLQTIEQYIAAEMNGKIERKRKPIVVDLLVLVVGIALLVLVVKAKMSDSLQAATLTVGLIALAVGVILTFMNLSGALWYYMYVPTGCRCKDKTVYLGADDYRRAVEALNGGNKAVLGELRAVTTSNGALRILRSSDGAFALVQAGRLDSSSFEVETPVVLFADSDVISIERLCK